MVSGTAAFTSDEAARLDDTDPLHRFRDEFVVTDPSLIYLDGNSLGRLPKRTMAAVRRVVEEEWGGDLVRGWEGWLGLGLRTGDSLAPLIGAAPGEVALCDQTGINLYKLVSAAMDATGRSDIVTDAGNFPSDGYILEAIAAARDGTLRIVDESPDAAAVVAAVDDRVGVVALTHVSYRTAAILDMEAITQASAAGGAIAVWDLSHSAGAVPVDLSGCGVELAVGCTYKYLNGGPGAPAFLFVAAAMQQRLQQPIAGWFGHADQFAFAPGFVPAPDIRRFQVGTPPILSMVAAGEGIAVTVEAGMDAIRAKSTALTGCFIAAVRGLDVASPLIAEHRGSHVAIRHPNAGQITQALRSRDVIVDFRAPDLVRFGFAPLYNTFDEAWRAAQTLLEVIGTEDYRDLPEGRGSVT